MTNLRAWLRKVAFGVALNACLTASYAVTLQISPVTIELSDSVRGSAITLFNPGDAPIYGQLRVFEWDQQDGEDQLLPTQNLTASPPIIEIAPGQEQLVRIVRTDDTSSAKELSYRIIIDEISDEQSPARSGVVIRMRYSVPIFVDNGLSANDRPQLNWTLTPGPTHWQLRVDNHGEKRARISSVWLRDAQGRRHNIQEGLLGYALAGRYRTWDLDIPSTTKLGSDPEVHVTVDIEPMVINVRHQPPTSKRSIGSDGGH